MKLRKSRINKIIVSSLICCSAMATFRTVRVCLQGQNIFQRQNERIIPPEFLLLSDDKQTLYGFTKETSLEEIRHYETLEIPDTIKNIAPFAFSFVFDGHSNNISKIRFNDQLENIGDAAFKGCGGITNINFEDIMDSSNLISIGDEAFSDCKLSGDLCLPNRLKSIGNRCFYNCQYIDGILKIPASLENVGKMAFAYCRYINKIDFRAWTTSPKWMYEDKLIFQYVGDSFAVQKNREVWVKEGTVDLDQWRDLLYERQQLVSFDESISGFLIVFEHNDVPQSAFLLSEDKKELLGFSSDFDISTLSQYNRLITPDTVESIANNAFDSKLTKENCKINVVLNEKLKKIGNAAFAHCDGIINTLYLPFSLNEIGNDCFCDCTGIGPEIELPNGISIIGERAFKNCTSLQTLIFNGQYDMEMKKEAFMDCTSVTCIDFSAFVSGFPTCWMEPGKKPVDAFKNISATGQILTNDGFVASDEQNELLVEIGITNLGKNDKGYEDSFDWWWYSQSDKNIPFINIDYTRSYDHSKLWGLNSQALEIKTQRDTIDIPHVTQVICDNAFKDVFTVTHIEEKNYYWKLILNIGLSEIGNSAFQACSNILGKLYIPDTVTKINNMAFSDCTHLIGLLTLPKELTYLGSAAFSGCCLLSHNMLELPENLSYIGENVFSQTQIKGIKLNKSLNHFVGSPFNGIPLLETLDLTNIDFVSTTSWEIPSSAFMVQKNTGKVIVKDNKEQWEQKLHNEWGLPSTWEVKLQGEVNNE